MTDKDSNTEFASKYAEYIDKDDSWLQALAEHDEEVTERHKLYIRGIASVAICAAAAVTEYVSAGTTGIGWAIAGLCIIWW